MKGVHFLYLLPFAIGFFFSEDVFFKCTSPLNMVTQIQMYTLLAQIIVWKGF